LIDPTEEERAVLKYLSLYDHHPSGGSSGGGGGGGGGSQTSPKASAAAAAAGGGGIVASPRRVSALRLADLYQRVSDASTTTTTKHAERRQTLHVSG